VRSGDLVQPVTVVGADGVVSFWLPSRWNGRWRDCGCLGISPAFGELRLFVVLNSVPVRQILPGLAGVQIGDIETSCVVPS
jgi:hypothetical protein